MALRLKACPHKLEQMKQTPGRSRANSGQVLFSEIPHMHWKPCEKDKDHMLMLDVLVWLLWDQDSLVRPWPCSVGPEV